MKRFAGMVAALVLTLGLLVTVAPRAAAESSKSPASWQIKRYSVTATPQQPDGTTKIEVDFDFDFAGDPGHGPFITLVTRMRVAGDPDHWRSIEISDISAFSRTGADVTQQVKRQADGRVIRFGQKGRTFTGVQNYRITYTAKGIINPRADGSGLDEFNWNVITVGDVPIRALDVTVNGPVATTKNACFQGRSLTIACTASSAGSAQAEFSATDLTKGQSMQVVAGFPGGTFPDAQVQLSKRLRPQNMFPLTPVSLGAGGLAAVLGSGLVAILARRSGRDKVFQGLPPGVVPAANQHVTIGRAAKGEVPVAFSPPRDTCPGEIGTLIDESADNRDVTAGILDLAVRGHLTIQPEGAKNFTLLRHTKADDPLRKHETQLLHDLFSGATEVSNHDLRKPSKSGVLSQARSRLDGRVVELGWFTASPSTRRILALVIGILVFALGLGLAFGLGALGFGWVGVGIAIAGLVLVCCHRLMPSRTALGSAVLTQAQGFRTYLTTAEADQITFEEGIDVFSRYLPYAVVFGVADRWVKVFQQLAAEGRYVPDTTWYGTGSFVGFHSGGLDFSNSLTSLTQSMTSSMQAATAAANSSSGSGGSSGFSGGGGVGGGSVGGW